MSQHLAETVNLDLVFLIIVVKTYFPKIPVFCGGRGGI